MSQTIDAIFDGKVFQPTELVELEPNTRVRVTIEPIAQRPENGASFLRTARALNLVGPADWSTTIEDYLDDQERGDDGHPLCNSHLTLQGLAALWIGLVVILPRCKV